MHKKIAFFEVTAWEKEWLVKNLGGFEPKFYNSALNEEHIPPERHFQAISVGEGSFLTNAVLEAFSHLELIVIRGREFGNIDLVSCRNKKIMVCRAPTYAVHAVAEFTFALLLMLSRRVCEAVLRQKTGSDATLDRLRGFDLYGKTLGVLGTGNIGSAVIRIAKGFGMKVIAWNPKQNLQLASELGFAYMPFLSVLAHADVLTIHLPHVQGGVGQTHHLLNREALTQMKRGSLLINTSGADIIDNDALGNLLQEGVLAGAALDVEPGTLREDFLRQERFIITPRMAFNTQETLEHLLRATTENIHAYFRGFPQHTVGQSAPAEHSAG
ncbi:MAG: NAD(P)-dependent oxidoreductase [bacterium]|nr:NAD(P)-dependent oxidoreductase [bacterium]